MSKKKTIVLLATIILILVAIVWLIFNFGKEKKRTVLVGMITTGSIDEAGWNRHHYIGLKKASEDFNIELSVKQNVEESTGKCVQAVEELIEDGAKLIILGSYNYQSEVKALIDQNPDINFYCCSSDVGDENCSTYFVRAYQARYLAGIVAGKQTENNKLGYVAAMPNSEVYRGINAFTMGAQSVNPDIEVYVEWTGSWSDEEAERSAVKKLCDEVGVDLITYHQNQDFVIDEAEKHGIYSIGYHEYMDGYSDKYLTAVVESWENVYSEILKEYMQGNGNRKPVIWLGIEKDAVGITECTAVVGEETKTLVDAAKTRMQNGWEIFSDTIIDVDGNVKCQDGEAISDDILFRKMDWFVKGVVQYEK